MTKHKYRAGARVHLSRGAADAGMSYGTGYTIVRQMPAGTQGPMYRIKGDGEAYERVALESQLASIF
jgi:hypothetical protein